MGRSLPLTLYLANAARGKADLVGPRPERPAGPLVWLYADAETGDAGVAEVVRQLSLARVGLRLLLTREGARDPAAWGAGAVLHDVVPGDRLANIVPFVDHWAPDLVMIFGASLPPALIVELSTRGVPILLADIGLFPGVVGNWRRTLIGALVPRLALILTRDKSTALFLRRLGGPVPRIEVTGRLTATPEPLRGNEAERAALAGLLATRPLWLAAHCPRDEEEAVLTAHLYAMSLAHRMLLIFVPAEPERGAELADAMSERGLITALRSREEEPEPDVQLYVADTEGEDGLWYRLAPVTYMGGTLSAGGSRRSPFEPAALGSAIAAGPRAGAHADAYARLEQAGALRQIGDGAGLADAVGELIAPDKAALLAQRAWESASEGAEVTSRIVGAILAALEGRALS